MSTEHAKLSASGAHRWMACPGSVALEAPLPDQPSEYAEEGTRAHELAELCLRRGMNARDLPVDEERFPDDMRDGVQVYLERVRETAKTGELHVEQRVPFDQWVPEGFGTADALILRDGHAELLDLKFGYLRVEAERNAQLMLYALGALQAHGWLYDLQRWTLTVVQPRLEHIDSWEVSTEELLAWADEVVRAAAERALAAEAPLEPGETQCRFCRAGPTCRARAEANIALAQDEFAEPFIDPKQLSPAELGALLVRLPEFEQWAKDVREHALAELLANREVPGFKLVAGRSQRRWTDEEAAAKALRKAGHKVGEIYVKKLIGIPAATKLLGAKAERLDPFIVKPPGKPVLAADDDPRPALERATPAEDFADDTSAPVPAAA